MATPRVGPARSSPKHLPWQIITPRVNDRAKRGQNRAKLEPHVFINTAWAKGDRGRDGGSNGLTSTFVA